MIIGLPSYLHYFNPTRDNGSQSEHGHEEALDSQVDRAPYPETDCLSKLAVCLFFDLVPCLRVQAPHGLGKSSELSDAPTHDLANFRGQS